MDNFVTVVGVGTSGVQVLEQLYSQGTAQLTGVACLADLDQLRNSVIPTKLFLSANDQSDKALLDLVQGVAESTELIFVVADLTEPESLRAVLKAGEGLDYADCLKVAVVAFDPAIISPPEISALEGLYESVMWFKMAGSQIVYHMNQTIAKLSELFQANWGMVDFSDVRYTVKGSGLAAVIDEQAAGERRIEAVLAKAIDQLADYPLDRKRVDRVLIQVGYSPVFPYTMREQQHLINGLMGYLGTEPRLFKTGYVIDATLAEQIRLTMLLWTPLE